MGRYVAERLKTTRKILGFTSARSFYIDLESKAELLFNYSYYMKIEAGELTPSEKIIHQISGLIPTNEGDLLVAAFCQDLFPERMPRLLKSLPLSTHGSNHRDLTIHTSAPIQQELTPRQIHTLAESQDNYFCFLVITLSRVGLAEQDLSSFAFDNLKKALKTLCDAKIIYEDSRLFRPSHSEFKFPAPSNNVNEAYRKLDNYDLKKSVFFKLEKFKSASFFKRISPKYLQILQSQFDVVFQLIRTAEETDPQYNNEIISFELKVHKGQIPG